MKYGRGTALQDDIRHKEVCEIVNGFDKIGNMELSIKAYLTIGLDGYT